MSAEDVAQRPPEALEPLVTRYKSDPESVCNTWFVDNDARLKAFRAIRRGVSEVVRSIREGTFGNDFKGSPRERLTRDIIELDRRAIKGLGPAVANILYFLHPTHFPPFNTAIVRWFNALFAASKRLGSWRSIWKSRTSSLSPTRGSAPPLSTDLGAFAGLL
ncbi:MAG: hypothetical protein ACYC9Q_02810 [Bacillota bacterium]